MGNHITDRIEDYLTETLDPGPVLDFEQHVASCRSCREALEDARDSGSYLRWLAPLEAPPQPGPEFYFKVQRSIEKKLDSGWLSGFAAAMPVPRPAFPLLVLFLFLGLLLTAWSMKFEADWSETGVLGIPPARYSFAISSEADRMRSRDMVMVSLVETLESN